MSTGDSRVSQETESYRSYAKYLIRVFAFIPVMDHTCTDDSGFRSGQKDMRLRQIFGK